VVQFYAGASAPASGRTDATRASGRSREDQGQDHGAERAGL